MRGKLAHADRIIARIASRQHGVVALEQLYRAGLCPDAVNHRVRTGRLHRIHRGVYAVGRPELGMKGKWKAATLALGGGAVLSHRSAAELWGLLKPRRGPIDVTVPRRTGHAKRNDIRVHRSIALNDSVATLRDGIPVTKPRRTLADLKRVLKPADLREAIRAAEISGLPIGDYTRLTQRTKSELELMFVELIRRHRLPDPEVNVRIGRFLVDFLWRARRVIVEVDGRRFHRGALATSDDLLRDQRLRELGYIVLRFGYWQVVNEPGEVVEIVRTRL